MAGKLKCVRVGVIPLAEVSALAVRQSPTGAELVAMGDRAALLATAGLSAVLGAADPGWRVVDLGALPGAAKLPGDRSQAEALVVAGDDQLVILWENPDEVVVCDRSGIAGTCRLVVPPSNPLAESWDDPGSSHGEGLVLLSGGRLLVAKEKDPPALVEFGPVGSVAAGFGPGQWLPPGQRWPDPPDELVALAHWQIPRGVPMRDLSDAALGPRGELLLLSDRDEAVHVVDGASPGSRRFTARATYRLSGLSGKPEGLAVAPDGALLVATDDDHGRDNLFRVAPGWADH